MKSRVTIKDIAAECQLTPSAVSRALRDLPDISEPTKRKVRDIASRLGYIKNSTASALQKGRSHQIAIVYDNLINPYFSIMTQYLQDSLVKYGYSFVTFTGLLNEELFMTVVSRNVDGIISFLEPSPIIDELTVAYGVPVLLLGRRTDARNIDYISTDDKLGGRLAAEHLIGCGCRKIAYLSEGLHITCAADRFEGFRAALQDAGLFDERRTLFLNGRHLADCFDEFLERGNEVDGLFCFNDMLAFEALYLMEQRGMRGIKVMGYDNIQSAIRIPHQLTTIGSDQRQMAEVAVEVLLYKIDNEKSVRQFKKFHEVFLVPGETA